MASLHIYKAKDQPAISYVVHVLDKAFRIKNPRKRRLPCFRCKRDRNAENMIAHAYFDATYYFCRDKRRCKRKRGR